MKNRPQMIAYGSVSRGLVIVADGQVDESRDDLLDTGMISVDGSGRNSRRLAFGET